MELADISQADMTALNAQGYTEQDLSMLAKSEVAALLAVPSDDSGSGNSSSDPHGDAAAAQDAANAGSGAATASANADNGAADDAGAPANTTFVPQYSADVPEDAADRIKALKAEESTAFKQLMDGEIDSDAYQAIRSRVEAETDDLKTQALTASIFSQANAQAAEQTARAEWNRAEAQAFNAFKAEGLDYKGKPALLAAYNTHLKALGADPKNENRDAPWFLAEAHRITKADLGFVTTPPATNTNKPAPNARNGVDLSELPPTLRSVPVAATGSVNADEFAHMRNLEGIELERAHARLTPEQRDRWMAE
jgi:hypothetical protein